MLNDYFALEEPLVNQLKTIEGIEAVYTHFSIEDMMVGVAIKPSISVIYVDDRVSDSAGNGKANTIYQQWLVVLALEDASSQLEQTYQIRKSASPLIKQILSKLQGFNPNIVGVKPFQRANAGIQHMSAAGALWMPFLFEAQIINIAS